MSSYAILWPEGDSSIVSASTGYELYDTLDEESDPESCLIIPITPNCHLKIEREFDRDAEKHTGRLVLALTGETEYEPKFMTFNPGAFGSWMAGFGAVAKTKETLDGSPKRWLKQLTRKEVDAFFEENKDVWVAECFLDEDDSADEECEKAEEKK